LNKLYAIGVGPGDPELLTLKAHRILQEVAAIFVPKAKEKEESVALDITRRYIPDGIPVEFLYMPMISCRIKLNDYWEKAAENVLKRLMDGDVAFLTLGDSLTYSTASYLLEAIQRMQPQIKVEFVPGITSFAACAARAGLPLVEGDETLVIVPSVGAEVYLKDMLSKHENCVLMKVSRSFDTIVKVLDELNLKEQTLFISRCGTEKELITNDIDRLRGQQIDYLSLMIVKAGKKGGLS